MKNTLQLLEFDSLKETIGRHIQTRYGKETLKSIEPEFNLEKAKKQYEIMLKFFEYFIRWGDIAIDDIYITPIVKSAFDGMLDEKELKKIGDFIGQLTQIREFLTSHEQEVYQYIEFDIPYQLFDEIKKAIDNYGLLKDTATAHLFEIRQNKKATSQNITRILKSIMHSKARDVIMDTAIFLKSSRYTILVKPNYSEYFSGRIIEVARSGGMFVEPDAVYKENSKLEELIAKEEAERKRILQKLTQLVRENAKRLRYNEKKLGFLDLNCAKYAYSKTLPDCEIEYSKKPILFAKNARHPVLATIKETKPVDIDLKSSKNLIITGPNTGGKTVFLKTVGLIALSFYSTIPINAEYLEIGEFDNVFAVIGDQQDIFESLSGFSAKMIAFKKAYSKATDKTLLLLDEIGSGTAADEGEAIAYAIIKNAAKKSIIVATTHYKKLAYTLQNEGFRTAAFEFDIDTLKPTYRLIYDRIGRSYGIEILKTLSVDEKIVFDAEKFLSMNETLISKVEKQLQRQTKIMQQKAIELESTKKRYLELIKNEQAFKEKLTEELNQLKEQKKEEYEKLLDEIKHELKNLLKSKNISKAHKKLNEISKQAQSLFNTEKKEDKPHFIQIGDRVSFNNLEGVVVSIKENKATIEVDGKAIKVDASKLKKIQTKQDKEKKINIFAAKNLKSLELNLIGKRRDEAYYELLRFVDSLSKENVESARIIHGIGNGILKDMVRETLKQLPYVRKFYPAHPSEGGDGATIVEFE